MGGAILTNHEGRYGVEAAIQALRNGRAPLDALEAGIRDVESDPLATTVGYGGAPNMLGEMELDAAMMDGDTLQAGSVGALKGYAHPVSVARQVMERLPHVMLVGEGAARFAAETGAEPGENLSPEAEDGYRRWNASQGPGKFPDRTLVDVGGGGSARNIALGTTVFLALNDNGSMAGGTSTSGWAYKYPGRLGDSPIIGAGLYVDSRHGGAVCTHTGEMTIRAGTARAIVAYMRKGADVESACHEALDDLRSLKGGFLGAVIIHAMDKLGRAYVLGTGYEKGFPGCGYYYWDDTMAQAEKRLSAVAPLHSE